MKTIRLLSIWAVCIVASFLALGRMFFAIFLSPDKAWRISVATDRQANVAFNGNEKETISSRAYRGTKEGRTGWCILCKFLNLLDRGHCEKSEGV